MVTGLGGWLCGLTQGYILAWLIVMELWALRNIGRKKHTWAKKIIYVILSLEGTKRNLHSSVTVKFYCYIFVRILKPLKYFDLVSLLPRVF